MEIDGQNKSTDADFVILGFSTSESLQIIFFVLFLFMHLITLSGHMAIVVVTLVDLALYTPMYFFLRNLSFIEVCYTLVIVPQMLANFLARSKRVSLSACAAQMYFFIALGGAECFLLAVMAYDRYVAICNPLRYTVIMSRNVCIQLLVVACVSGFTISLGLTTLIFSLPFCGSHTINHFFCDIPPVLFLACSDTHANEVAVFLVCMMILLIPFLLILVSYVFITNSILRIKCTEGRKKAFSTCAAHLVVAVLHYGCAIFIYIRPKASYSLDNDKVVSLFYTNVTPMLYPMIYSLRNKEVKGALKRVWEKKFVSMET
ncbi:olfactory receptor 10Q1-like [Hemicordylus capensis]|uniref:olfactory receptor 10Q1-like n=1 Tax=Hemicordylus capensis TaxID=884348 RepID=UPI0023025B8D|nr:olfactory receptor 10Q1-like [Hemicordylus capensis]XP_053145190.1 olfactory receptor 10Q1-like [Hemicordylus capensis]XP_053145191.1 olfactory receptor 10Q1-like [Hemicordylus capensis]XP_053145192.1 olfactory receptor 10Q1-like [Hemicordylus capensis]